MQIEVHHIRAKITGTRLAAERVHIGAVHVEQRTLGMQNLGNAMHLMFKDADR